jgi:hypothetical protein
MSTSTLILYVVTGASRSITGGAARYSVFDTPSPP